MFEGDILQTTVWSKKEERKGKKVLANPNNKLYFINKLSNVCLEVEGFFFFETLHAADDADCLIVGTTLKLERNRHRSRWRIHRITGASIISRST